MVTGSGSCTAGASKSVDQGFGHGIGYADTEFQGTRMRMQADHLLQFGFEREYLFGIAESEPSGFGEFQLAALPPEQFAAEILLQKLDLAAYGLWRDVQVFAGADDAAELRHFPEILKMFQVHGAAFLTDR